VSQENTSWHHCGKCGEVYKAAKGSLCPACERTPIPSRKKINVHTVEGSSTTVRKEFSPNLSADAPTPGNLIRIGKHSESGDAADASTRKSTERKRKKQYSLLKFMIGWCVALILLAGLIKWKFSTAPAPVTTTAPTNSDAPNTEARTLESENLDLINQAYQSMQETTAFLLDTNAPETLAQYCRQRPRIVSIIFNDGPKASLFKPESIQLTERNVIRPGGLPMIETIWKDDRGRMLEMVFAKEEDRWVVDWESYAKSSTLPWSVFQGADGEEEGVFRMLVRERLVDQTYSDLQMSVVFYEPSFLRGGPLGLATTDFLVDRKSRDGRLLTAALEARKNNKPLLGSIFPQADPPNTARVCVKIRRSIKDGQKVFTLVEVLACHWLGIDDPGVTLTDAP